MRSAVLSLILAAATIVVSVRAAPAEVFVLTSGGRVVGELLNPDETPRRTFMIRTASGGQLILDRDQVDKVLHPRPEELQYEKIRPRFPDTVDGQWALAEWCRENLLSDERKIHLERIVELEPDHAQARRALGYIENNGTWMTREEIMAERGYRMYKGRYRTTQEIELMEKRRTDELAEKEWFAKLKRWRGWLGTERDGEARKNILAIDKPEAVNALVQGLTNDPSHRARILYIEVLARIGTSEAVDALAERAIALEEPVEEVRLTCLDYLEPMKNHRVTEFFVAKLRHKDNRIVNRAALALGRLKDPSSAGPLIDALVTVHKFKIQKGSPGQMSSTFGTGPGGSGAPGGGGLSMGGGPKIVSQAISNQAVLDALVSITGQNFSFDQRAWKYWYAQQKPRATIDGRRGP